MQHPGVLGFYSMLTSFEVRLYPRVLEIEHARHWLEDSHEGHLRFILVSFQLYQFHP